jgi:hypothetical protein
MHAAGRRCPDRPAASYQTRRGQPVIFVQADLEDGPAIALYRSLGTIKTAYHFDIEVAAIKAKIS